MTDEEEDLDEDTQERIDRVRGKREDRPSRRRGRGQQPQQSEQPPQAEQEEQEEQAKEAKQDSMDANTQTETAQADEAGDSQQPTQAAQVAQAEGEDRATVSELEPVTQREHDTYYLDEEVRDELERVYRRMSLDILEETGVDVDDQAVGGRNRYFRPLALLLGAREISDMSPAELRETLQEEELIDDLPESE